MASAASTKSGVSLHPMKKIEIIVPGESEAKVSDILKLAGVSGYTIIRNASGMGHHGFHEGKLLYNDQASLEMFIAVAPENVISNIAVGLKAILEKNSGVMFVSDVSVARFDYFIKS